MGIARYLVGTKRVLLLALTTTTALGIGLYLYSMALPLMFWFLGRWAANPASIFSTMGTIGKFFLLLSLVQAPITLPVASFISWLQGFSTQVNLGNEGIRIEGKAAGLKISTPLISWSAISYAGCSQESDGSKALELHLVQKNLDQRTWISLLCLCPAALMNSGLDKIVKLKISESSFPSELDLERLVLALSDVLPEENCFDLARLSPAQLSLSYTDLWLDGLSPETRSGVLTEGMLIADGKYQIDRIVGSGGEGVVYSAKQLNDSGECINELAIKEFVLPVRGGYECVARALQHIQSESNLLSQLSHPGIIKLLDTFVENHRVYLVLELLSGKTLAVHIEESGSLPESQVIRLALSMCDLLEYLHSQTPPIIHRDFTPDNLMLLADGQLKLIDFNVAWQLEAVSTQSIVGKHSYVPPEQLRGKASQQSDLYALGATLHYLLTGLDPEPIAVSHPKLGNPSISNDIDEIVSKLTQQDATARYQNANEIRSAILAIGSHRQE